MNWRSDALPVREQFAAWREACCQRIYAVTPERREREGFRGAIAARRIGGLDVADLQCEGHLVSRREEDIRRAPSDTYYIYCQVGEGAWFEQEGRHVAVARGDIVLADPNVPFSTGTTGDDFHFRIWRVPRRDIDAYLGSPARLPMIHLPSSSAACALVSSCLVALAAQAERLDPRIVDPVADSFVRLVAMTAGIAPELDQAGHDAVRAATLERGVQLIDKRYGDAALSPGVAARALGMSVRKLHLVFAASGRTFGDRLSERRLGEARRLLTGPTAAARSIADVAFSVGFNDLSTFHRAFRGRWGATPGDVRRAAAALVAG